jgi:hypothetical protein
MNAPRRPAPKRKPDKPSRAAMARAVASSTAIETGQPIDRIERLLSARNSKFRHLALAR